MKQMPIYHFMAACGGNWHNAIYISGCSSEPPLSPGNMDYLCAIDRDGIPCLINVHGLQETTGEPVSKEDCLLEMSCSRFRSLYQSYWIQHVDFPQLCGMRQLFICQQNKKRESLPF